ncbi:MAG TPA: hypothetical protein PK213_16140 [Deltaproteobacteria bacterium]|nr:hypothetical protein [Deltaproteobacteria bacterium]
MGMTDLALCATVRVSWNANTEPDIAGYKLYGGTSSGTYTYVVDTGLNTSRDVPNLSNGAHYYFAVTAYDTSGNESGYSQEVHVLIPENVSGGGQPASPVDSDFDGIPDAVETSLGLDPSYALDAIEDSDGDGVVNLVEYMAGTSPLDASEHPANDNILKDLIGAVGQVIDLSSVNPQGSYEIVPLDGSFPEPVNNTVILDDPGAYLYNIFDGNAVLVYSVRISVSDHLYSNSIFAPGSVLNIIDQALGIRIQIPGNAQVRQLPIGIGGTGANVSSGQAAQNGVLQFDVLPLGLDLASPAVITVNFEASSPTVQRYDTESGSWVNVEDVSASDGQVSFPSSQLGTFRVVDGDASPVSSGGGGGGGGGGCFISTAGL